MVWSFDGTVWAVFAYSAAPWRRAPLDDKLGLHRRLATAAQLMPGDWMVLGASVPLTADDLATAMSAHVDLDANPGWADRTGRDAERIVRAGLHRRVHFIAAALPAAPGDWRLALASAQARIGRRFGLVPPPVKASEFAAYRRAADDLGASLGRALGTDRFRPATTAEVLWLYARAAARGLPGEPVLGDYGTPRVTSDRTGDDARLRCAALVDLDDATYLEGGGAEEQGRRYLRVDGSRGRSYQSILAVADMPEEWSHPGSALLALVDTLGFAVDWAIRCSSTPNADTQAAVKKQLRELTGQYDEHQGDPAGAGPALDRAVSTLTHEWEALAANPAAPGLKVTFLLAVGAPTLAECEKRTRLIRDAYGASDYQLHAPPGDQDALHGAMLPAGTCPPAVDHYAQFMLPADLAGCAWGAGNTLGEETGAWLGLNMDAPARHPTPVLYSPANGPRTGKAGSFAAVGNLGAGKSHLLKAIVLDTVERGGVVVVTDRTGGAGGQDGEYVRLRHVFSPGKRTQVVPIGTPGAGTVMDPLAAFDAAEDRVRYGTGFLTLITGTVVRSAEGGVLEDAVAAVVASGGRLADVGPRLEAMGDEDARRVAAKLARFARGGGLAEVAFGRGETVRLDADFIVFHAPHLVLPEPEQMADPDSLLPEQVVGIGVVYLIAAIARTVVLADDTRFGLYVQDEAYVMRTPQGQQVLREFARDGRKRNGGVGLATHHSADIGDPRLAELLTARFAFRMSASAAPDALAFLGLEVSAANIAVLGETERHQGECLARFPDGSVGLVATNPAPTAAARAAFDTTPGARPMARVVRQRRPRIGAVA